MCYENTLQLKFGRQYNIYKNNSSQLLLVRLKESYIQKISVIFYLILKIAMKKTLKFGFGRRLQGIENFVKMV